MKIVKVLFLDDAPWFLPNLTSHGIKLEVIQEALWGTMNVYSAPTHVCEAVEGADCRQSRRRGHRQQHGCRRCEGTSRRRRHEGDDHVVWNSYHKGDERPYTDLGLKHFGSRNDLPQLITEMLGIAT